MVRTRDTTTSQGETAERGRSTLADVAREAKVSVSTASLAFSGRGPVSERSKKRVMAAAERLGYAGPDARAASFRRGRSNVVAVLIDGTLEAVLMDPVHRATLEGISERFDKDGLSLLLVRGVDDPARTLETAPVDGVIVFGCSPRLDVAIERIADRGMPIVTVEGSPNAASRAVCDIALDSREATRALAEVLRDVGHERVSIVSLPIDESLEKCAIPENLDHVWPGVSKERIIGTREVFPRAGGLAVSRSSFDEGFAAALELLAAPGGEGTDAAARTLKPLAERPTAIVAQSDVLAAGVIRAAEVLGLSIPADLSVVGFDGVRIDGFDRHEITTARQQSREKGAAAGHAIADALEGASVTGRTFTAELVPGNTVAPPPAA